GIPYIIFRPSLIIGRGDGFTENLLELINHFPVVPVPGRGEARLQPLSVDDWVSCFLRAMEDENFVGKTIEFGGPEHLTYNEILRTVMRLLGVKKPIIHMPKAIVKAGLPIGRLASFIGIKTPPVTAEQIELLQVDNITDRDSIRKQFGFEPEGYEEALRKALGGV
ncbi:MAG: complex I NDUFA9 subunit family protein, partial [Nitrospirae bacterium]